MENLRFTVTKNGLANLVRGGATAAVVVLLPRFLVRSLDTEHFAAWALILQIAAYSSYLDFGLQTAVARFIAQAIELNQRDRQAKLVSTALVLLSLAGVVAFGAIAVIVWQSPHLFKGVPLNLLHEFRDGALLLSVSACLLLPLSTYTGVLVGMHRNEIPAMAIGGSRLAGAIAVIIASYHTQSLAVLALCFGIPGIIGGLVQMAAAHGLLKSGWARLRNVNRVIGVEFLRFCGGLTIWSACMLLITGLDVTIVGYFQFSAAGFYSISALLITFFSGLTNAGLAALMAPIATLHARGESRRIEHMTLITTRMTLFANLCLTAVVFLWGGPLLRLWVGPVYANLSLPILKILAFAQTLRLLTGPYSMMLIGIGEHNRGINPAICEALVNLAASIAGMKLFGPIGVAWGTLAGAVCGVLWYLLRTMPSVTEVCISMRNFLLRAMIPGALPCFPLVMLWMIQGHVNPFAYTVSLVVCVALTVAVVWMWSFRNRSRSIVF